MQGAARDVHERNIPDEQPVCPLHQPGTALVWPSLSVTSGLSKELSDHRPSVGVTQVPGQGPMIYVTFSKRIQMLRALVPNLISGSNHVCHLSRAGLDGMGNHSGALSTVLTTFLSVPKRWYSTTVIRDSEA